MTNKKKITEVYGDVQRSGLLETRDPRLLTKMLFDKACSLLRASILSIKSGKEEKFQGESLHALQIVLSLRFVLDTSAEDELSTSLFDTYTTIAASLFRAREDRDQASLSKIYDALDELRAAWDILLSEDRAR